MMAAARPVGHPAGAGSAALPWLRLRQICLVARDLERTVECLHRLFGLAVSWRDPSVAEHGLHNAVMPVGTSFLEVVAPLREGTAASRHLARMGGDGGYMVIVNANDLASWRIHFARVGVRIVHNPVFPGYEGLHLHPKDTGGPILELNHQVGGEAADGPYHAAGHHWQDFVHTAVVRGIAGVALHSRDPRALARRWGEILQRPVAGGDALPRLELDGGVLDFVAAPERAWEGIAAIALDVVDAGHVAHTADVLRLPHGPGYVTACGLKFTWSPA